MRQKFTLAGHTDKVGAILVAVVVEIRTVELSQKIPVNPNGQLHLTSIPFNIKHSPPFLQTLIEQIATGSADILFVAVVPRVVTVVVVIVDDALVVVVVDVEVVVVLVNKTSQNAPLNLILFQ